MNKFWNKAETGADIYIYGDITSYGFFDNDVTAKSFVEDLDACGSAEVTVHINSGGGDVFQALAISNVLKSRDNVTVSIDGLAASAASLIAVSGRKVKMAANALMMIHSPSVGLYSYYDAEQLAKVQNSLAAIEDVLIATYSARAKGTDVRELLKAETWLTAEQAQEYGFVDEITGAIEMQFDDAQQMLFVNSLAVSTKKYDAMKMRRAMEGKKEMTAELEQKYMASVRAAELARIGELQKLKGDNAAVNALIDAALEKGDTAEQIAPYLDAVRSLQSKTTATAAMAAVIQDQLTGGGQDVSGGQGAISDTERRKQLIAKFANEMV